MRSITSAAALVKKLGMAVVLAATAASVQASSISLTGSLDHNDPNDVLFVAFALPGTATVQMQSYGFGGSAQAPGGVDAAGNVIAPGGFDPYFSLFSGVGPSAAFLASNDDGSCPPGDDSVACRDSALAMSLAAGSYTLTVSAFDNMSFAENLGSGTLGDGFIGLGSYFNLDCSCDRSAGYAVDIVAEGLTLLETHRLSDVTSVPEPSTVLLLAAALIGCGLRRDKRPAAGAGKRMQTVLGRARS